VSLAMDQHPALALAPAPAPAVSPAMDQDSLVRSLL